MSKHLFRPDPHFTFLDEAAVSYRNLEASRADHAFHLFMQSKLCLPVNYAFQFLCIPANYAFQLRIFSKLCIAVTYELQLNMHSSLSCIPVTIGKCRLIALNFPSFIYLQH